ncbi:MAG TPA: transporter, partial [Phenylobacterium sp.]
REFCADRPGKATPPCILDSGHLQIETGLADAVFQRGSGAHEDLYTLGATEVRFGLTPRLEAEAAWAPLIVHRVRGAGRVTGVGDLTLGARLALSDPDARDGVAISAQGFVTAPTATHGLGAGGWTGGFRIPISAPALGGFALGVTPEVDVVRNAAGGGTHLGFVTAVAISRGFGDTTLGAELWGLADDDPARRSYQASFDLTAAHALGKNGQLDGGVNLALNRNTPDVEIYIGLSHRF